MGRLRWDQQSHKKWTLKNNDTRLFSHFETWVPLWIFCDKNHISPDIYFSFWNEGDIYKERQFDTLVTIAVVDEIENIPKEIVIELSKVFNSKRTVYNKRKWGEGKKDETGKWNFLNSILDTHSSGIYKDEKIKNLNMHSINFDEIIFEPYWEVMY